MPNVECRMSNVRLKRSVFFCVLLWLPLALVACGKKGPPLAPLRLVPDAAQNVTARRLGSTVYLQMSVPGKNANGPGPVAVDHLEIYAVTAAAGAAPPANRELLTSARVIGRIPVKPPPTDEETPPEENEPKDTRPGPGDPVTFTETITEAQLKPQILPSSKAGTATSAPAGGGESPTGVPPVTAEPPLTIPGTETPTEPPPATSEEPAAGTTSIGAGTMVPSSPMPTSPPATPPASTPAPAPPAVPVSVLTRIYMVRGMTKSGRPGSPSARLVVPLTPAPPVATGLATSFSETAVTVTWLPPVLEGGSEPRKFAYNVYVAPPTTETSQGEATKPMEAPTPLNGKPLDETSFEHPGVQPGVAQCFVVRTVETIAGAFVESEPSERACVTPRDIYPPAAPKGLSAVAGPGAINLIWDANTETDVAGYLILRGEAPGDTLQPLNNEPTRETRYRDATVTAGVRYIYAIVAVDRAGNRSAASARVEETAR
jgi:hypothetical protein